MEPGHKDSKRYQFTLSLAALGVVYGDIGTSPLYALRECFDTKHGVPPTHANVLGVLSLVLWSLFIIISLKYLVLVMRADNRGEGGVLALMSLIRARGESLRMYRGVLAGLGLFGAALLYGDSMITPAISVLSAVEGLEVTAPGITRYVIPITILVLIGLFAFQRLGTATVGKIFGPIMIIWFVTIATLGVIQIFRMPHVLSAINPSYAVEFFMLNGFHAYIVLGAVFLVVTGGESLYADMGHFGAQPIRRTWFALVFPSLLLNYFGQGALLLQNPDAREHPFFLIGPEWTRLPLVILATAAAIIASQAVISGAFSITRQAVQLGYIPRIVVRHTSAREIGQIYIPAINWMLMLSAIGLVLAFKQSSSLAAAYGVAVTGAMTITTILMSVVERERWKLSLGTVIAITAPLLLIDLSFLGSNLLKVPDGGWFPLVAGFAMFMLMSTWRLGRQILTERLAEQTLSIDDFLRDLGRGTIHRVPGTAIFMSRNAEGVPTTLLHNLKHNKVVHKHVVLLSVHVEETPHIAEEERYTWKDLDHGVHRLAIRYGFMEDPNIPETLATVKGPCSFQPMTTSYFLGRETVIATRQPGMALWREHVFAWMMRNSSSASQYFCLPPNQVIELGAQVQI
jgi:KUP system potassium uptake protein